MIPTGPSGQYRAILREATGFHSTSVASSEQRETRERRYQRLGRHSTGYAPGPLIVDSRLPVLHGRQARKKRLQRTWDAYPGQKLSACNRCSYWRIPGDAAEHSSGPQASVDTPSLLPRQAQKTSEASQGICFPPFVSEVVALRLSSIFETESHCAPTETESNSFSASWKVNVKSLDRLCRFLPYQSLKTRISQHREQRKIASLRTRGQSRCC